MKALKNAVEWAQKKNLAVIFDEVYIRMCVNVYFVRMCMYAYVVCMCMDMLLYFNRVCFCVYFFVPFLICFVFGNFGSFL